MEISREDHRIFIEEQGQLPAEFTFPCGQAGRGYQSYICRCIPARTGDKRRTDEGGGSCDKEEVLEMYGI